MRDERTTEQSLDSRYLKQYSEIHEVVKQEWTANKELGNPHPHIIYLDCDDRMYYCKTNGYIGNSDVGNDGVRRYTGWVHNHDIGMSYIACRTRATGNACQCKNILHLIYGHSPAPVI